MPSIKRFKIFLFICFNIFFISCANQTADNSNLIDSDFKIKNEWYRGDVNFQFWESNEELQTHGYFDVDPYYNEKSFLINYLPVTAKASNILYSLDLHSGKIFKEADLCMQDDVWQSFSPKVQGPSFTYGLIPRSSTGGSEFRPVKIAVFHSPTDLVIKKEFSLKEFSRAKILGSFYLEECQTYPCRNRDSWKKELVLVGVNIKNQSKKEIEESDYISFEKLITTQDWKEAKVFFQSQLGVHRLGKTDIFPKYRMAKEVGVSETKKRINEDIQLKSYEQIMGFRNSCRSMYDQMWTEVTKVRKSADPREEFKKFTIGLFEPVKISQINQCLAHVRAANINADAKRFWFFQYLRAAMILEKSGFYYNCNQKMWYPNPQNADSGLLYSTLKEITQCRSRETELLFEKAIIGLGLMENQVGHSYRFTEYDTQSGGSYQKIYSWLPVGTKRLDCKPSGKINLEDIFPEDVNWDEFPDGKQEGIR